MTVEWLRHFATGHISGPCSRLMPKTAPVNTAVSGSLVINPENQRWLYMECNASLIAALWSTDKLVVWI